MARVRKPTSTGDWEAATAVLSEYGEWIRTQAGFDPVAVQPGFGTELTSLQACYSGPDRRFFIADLDGMVVGTLALCRDGDGDAELKRMYVRPVARGRGVADALIAAALATAAEYGCRRVWLESVRGAMDPAIAVYRRNGFRIADHRDHMLDLDGVVVMERLAEVTRCA